MADPGFAKGGPRLSAEGARIEAPSGRAPQARVSRRRGLGFGEGVSPPQWQGSGEGGIAPSPENFSILSLKMATFSAFWVLFLQFIVHSSMNCLKRF